MSADRCLPSPQFDGLLEHIHPEPKPGEQAKTSNLGKFVCSPEYREACIAALRTQVHSREVPHTFYANLMRAATFAVFCAIMAIAIPAQAIEVRVSSPALERTLRAQLFTVVPPGAPAGSMPGRYYLKGSPNSACNTYADDPHITFRDDRIVVQLRTHSKFGTAVRGTCVGIYLATETEVSFIPVAEGESVGFRDAKIEHLSENRELNFLLEPFLSKKLPAEMKVNAATLMRTLLVHAPDQTGYTLTLTSLKLHSMLVEGQSLVVDLDANIKVD